MKVRPAVVILKEQSVLLMRYRYGSEDVYAFPGGGPEAGEHIEQTLVRELEEELKIKIKPEQFLLSGTVERDQKITLHLLFTASLLDGIPTLNPEQTTAAEVLWMPLEQLAQLTMYPHVGNEIIERLTDASLSPYLGKINQPWV